MDWFRWYHGTVSDPKFRVIAKKANASVAEVIAVWASMLECASQSSPRGGIEKYDSEDMSEALGMDANAIERIRTHMNNKVLQGAFVLNWGGRQPKREDGSAERAKAWRERKKSETNAPERTRTQTNTDKRREDIKDSKGKNSFSPPTLDEVKAYCAKRSRGVDFERWMNHYQSNGWMVGKNKMVDWKAAVRKWEEKPTESLTLRLNPMGCDEDFQ